MLNILTRKLETIEMCLLHVFDPESEFMLPLGHGWQPLELMAEIVPSVDQKPGAHSASTQELLKTTTSVG